ncbi:MAG: Ig-like domain-containing protein [Muribaculaceae bacterium]|nr:Ig-like domain-containing protein [Muribaculaceae bacterium]
MEWANNFSSRYIHKIELSYSPDLGGKQECGLSFATKSCEAFLGEYFNAPALKNPNKLDVSWSSSNENVATVDGSGKISLVGKGKTTITASTTGNDEFAAGNAKYELDVIATASNIAELLEYAPAPYDRVKVNFPATVNFASASIAFVTDADGNAACFDNISTRNSSSTTVTTIYSVGQVIPAGWIATNATIYESVIWEGKPDKVTETVEVTYAKVSSVTPADADRVVILKNVTFETRTPEGFTKAYGTTPDGTTYEFQDTYDISAVPAGTYDVTCVVRYSRVGSNEYFYLAPVAYSEASGEVSAPEFPESFEVSVSFDGAEVTQGEEYYVYTVKVTGEASEDTYTVTVEVPEGWDGFIGMTDSDFPSEPEPLKKVQSPEWVPLDYMLENGFKKGNTLTFPADGEEHMGMLYLYKGDMAEVANVVQIETEVTKEGNSVESIETAGKAEYYNLNGVRMDRPAKGLYIKVVNGKAVKGI